MGFLEKIKSNPLPFGVAGVAGIGLLAWLAFGFFGIQAAFIDNVVDEGGPVFASGAAEVEDAESDTASGDAAIEEQADVVPVEPAEAEVVEDAVQEASASVVEEAPDALAAADEQAPVEDEAAVVAEAPVEEEVAAPVEEAPVEEAPVEEAPVEEEPAQPGEIVTLLSGSFSSLNGYTVSGDVQVLNDGTEQRFLRFPDLNSDNGPDLKVYLRADNGEFISLGDLKGNIGDQNYEIPVDVDLSVFSNVEIWCERFSAGFGVASLTAP